MVFYCTESRIYIYKYESDQINSGDKIGEGKGSREDADARRRRREYKSLH